MHNIHNDKSNDKIDFHRIAQAALVNAESLLRSWLPDGKRQGREWIARNPTRHDGKPGSFTVNLNSGRWADFATDDRGGDLISLRAYLDNCTQLEAAQKIAGELGLAGGAKVNPRRPSFTKAPATRPAPTDKTDTTPPTGCPDGMPGSLRHPRHGEPSAAWMYTDRECRPLGYACRFNLPGSKIVLPYSWTGKGWDWKAMPEPRPLYRLPELMARKDAAVIVCEGEKAASFAALLLPEAVVTTWAGGCKAWSKTDWQPLKSRKVILWPDADEPGIEAMAEIKNHLLTVVRSKNVNLIKLSPGLPVGFDAADCRSRQECLTIISGKLPTRLRATPTPIGRT